MINTRYGLPKVNIPLLFLAVPSRSSLASKFEKRANQLLNGLSKNQEQSVRRLNCSEVRIDSAALSVYPVSFVIRTMKFFYGFTLFFPKAVKVSITSNDYRLRR